MNTITVLTDFGLKDPYAGIMKGVILGINPAAVIVDITHQVDPQDVEEAAFIIAEYYRCFPEGTVHLCVVDPTVGSKRKPVIVKAGGHMFVGPDNGLFSLVSKEGETTVHEIADRRFAAPNVSGTFHGRDIFAPAAAHLSKGMGPAEFGPALAGTVVLPGLSPRVEDGLMEGRIIRFDRFGNAISNIALDPFRRFTAGRPYRIGLGGLSFKALSGSYYEDRLTCCVGSSGYLEFALFAGSLEREMGLRKGQKVEVRVTR